MKKKLLVLLTLFAFMPFVNAEEYLVVDRDTQSNGVETVPAGEVGSYDLFYNKETGRFQIVYNITTEAPDEITLDLTKALELLNEYGRLAVVDDPDLQVLIEKGIKTAYFTYDGIGYVLDLESIQASALMSPSSVIGFDVVIKNNSGKAYLYKEGSLSISTPKQKEVESEIVGFDGQKLDEKSNPGKLKIGYTDFASDKSLINTMIDVMYEREPVKGYQAYVDTNGTTTSYIRKINVAKGSKVTKIKYYYYYEYNNYYIKIDSSKIDTANLVTKEDINELPAKAYDKDANVIYSYYDRTTASSSDTTSKFKKYIENKYNNDINAYLIEIFNMKFGTSYSSYKEFSEEDIDRLLVEISYTYMHDIGTVEITDSAKYDLFYKGLFSIVITTSEDFESNYEDKSSWASNSDRTTTIGNYMNEKVNEIEDGKYKETDSFLNETISVMKNEDSSSFTFGVNIDGKTNNNYQNYKFSYYASFKMIARKGVVIINYVDENGKPLKESETVKYYYYEDYETKAALFEDYELIEVEGLEKGTIEQDETVVTYIYQFTSGQGNDEPEEEPKKELVQTGSEVDYSIMTSAFITISLIGLAIYTHKKQN